jgi:hypothetical protein
MIEILKRIVGAIVGAPPQEGLKVPAIIKVLFVELPSSRHILGEELPF